MRNYDFSPLLRQWIGFDKLYCFDRWAVGPVSDLF